MSSKSCDLALKKKPFGDFKTFRIYIYNIYIFGIFRSYIYIYIYLYICVRVCVCV